MKKNPTYYGKPYVIYGRKLWGTGVGGTVGSTIRGETHMGSPCLEIHVIIHVHGSTLANQYKGEQKIADADRFFEPHNTYVNHILLKCIHFHLLMNHFFLAFKYVLSLN